MPVIEFGSYLVDYMFEVGSGGWADIRAWQECTGTHLSSWDAITLRSMIISYRDMSNRAREKNCPHPMREALPTPAQVADKIKSLVRRKGK